MTKRAQLDSLVHHFAGGNKAEFSRMLGISKQNLNTWYKYDSMDFEKVFAAFPEVSAEWLLTGEGEMLDGKRSPKLFQDDRLMPIISEENLRKGEWSVSECYVLIRGESGIQCDFLTTEFTGDLFYYIYKGATLGCKRTTIWEFIENCLYIIQTRTQSVFFGKFLGKVLDERGMAFKFTTCRGSSGTPDLRMEIPEEDIIQCAEISWYSVDHYVEHVV